ncbi:hypothetical protein GOC14_07165 [Sinorhizobium meliloti]|nr:hypothetical protein [Sinorhizobium meliloti]
MFVEQLGDGVFVPGEGVGFGRDEHRVQAFISQELGKRASPAVLIFVSSALAIEPPAKPTKLFRRVLEYEIPFVAKVLNGGTAFRVEGSPVPANDAVGYLAMAGL